MLRAVCPRCGCEAHAPTVWSSAWRCDVHGEIDPLRPATLPSREALDGLLRDAQVPVWVPWPLPHGWLVSGFAGAGDERTGIRASVVALMGPHPLGGPADLLVVAEEPGVGLGAGLAGLPGPDPGTGFASGAPHAGVQVANHEVQLWLVESCDRLPGVPAPPPGRPRGVRAGRDGGRGAPHDSPPAENCAAFAGEVAGSWLWLLLWPDSAGIMLLESLSLRDLRDTQQRLDLPFGALSTRLPA